MKDTADSRIQAGITASPETQKKITGIMSKVVYGVPHFGNLVSIYILMLKLNLIAKDTKRGMNLINIYLKKKIYLPIKGRNVILKYCNLEDIEKFSITSK